MKQPSSYWVRKAARTEFGAFLELAFRLAHPGKSFLPGKHLDVLAFALEDVFAGNTTRLIINMPPRFLKTFTVCTAWPAWLLGKNPAMNVLSASYSEALAARAAQESRLIIEHPAYQRLFPRTKLTRGENRKDAYVTTARGGRRSLSTGGAVTGEGGDILIIDDPLNAMDAMQPTKRDFANNWFKHAFLSRLNNPKTGAVIVVMQRLHPEDLSGHILETQANGWEVIRLPALTETPAVFYPSIPARTRGWQRGEPLHEARADADALSRLRDAIGAAAFNAQYQQRPEITSGALLTAASLQRYSTRQAQELLTQKDAVRIIQSWDCAAKTGEHCDYSVCVTIARKANTYIALHVFREKTEYVALKSAARRLAARFTPDIILIEDKSAGQALLQELRGELPVRAVNPKADKITRLLKISALFENGHVYIADDACATGAFRDELLRFPDGKHDDQVDALTQGLTYLRDSAGHGVRFRDV